MKYIKGDIFDSNANVILHQVNCQGVMGSGIAKQVKQKYPIVYKYYKMWCDDPHLKPGLLGSIQTVYIDNEENRAIINLFSQDKFGYDGKRYTDYDALRNCLKIVNKQWAGYSVAIPFHMGCDRGGGDWNVVCKMIEDELTDCNVVIYQR